MITQTLAIFVDAYRDLNARKMFWMVLGLNVLAMLVFAVLGSDGHTMTVLWYKPFGEVLTTLTYKKIYSNFVVGFWFTWVASLLALISTAGIFPDLMSSGSIDLYIAKPIGRLRLFLTKYVAGLLFVMLQVTIFTLLSFLVLGFRAGIWEPGLFLAIPLVVLFFSYLSAICTLLGVWTRSTIAALLLTILVWGIIFGVDFGDKAVGRLTFIFSLEKTAFSAQIDSVNAQLARADAGEIPLSAEDRKTVVEWRDKRIAERDAMVMPSALTTTQNIFFGIKTFFPKTRETISLLDRFLFQDKDLQQAAKINEDVDLKEIMSAAQPGAMQPPPGSPGLRGPRGRGSPNQAIQDIDFTMLQAQLDRGRSTFWVIGTSLLFEAVCLALAAWRFCTRDY